MKKQTVNSDSRYRKEDYVSIMLITKDNSQISMLLSKSVYQLNQVQT